MMRRIRGPETDATHHEDFHLKLANRSNLLTLYIEEGSRCEMATVLIVFVSASSGCAERRPEISLGGEDETGAMREGQL
jgi:hypothetical protein